MDKIIYKKLKEEEINEELFSKFNRYQEVKRCWRKHGDKWELEDVPFIEPPLYYFYYSVFVHNTSQKRYRRA